MYFYILGIRQFLICLQSTFIEMYNAIMHITTTDNNKVKRKKMAIL